jgi:hypothetical protein
MTCLADCPPSVFTALLTFVCIAGFGFALARWRRWTLILWIPLTYLVAAPFMFNGWAIDERGWMAMGFGWIGALLGGLRIGRALRSHEAA